MIRCSHCKRLLPPVPGSDEVKDPLPVSHACVVVHGKHGGVGGKTYATRVVPFVSPLRPSDQLMADYAEWDLGPTDRATGWRNALRGIGRSW